MTLKQRKEAGSDFSLVFFLWWSPFLRFKYLKSHPYCSIKRATVNANLGIICKALKASIETKKAHLYLRANDTFFYPPCNSYRVLFFSLWQEKSFVSSLSPSVDPTWRRDANACVCLHVCVCALTYSRRTKITLANSGKSGLEKMLLAYLRGRLHHALYNVLLASRGLTSELSFSWNGK